jgi:hypothetical protein
MSSFVRCAVPLRIKLLGSLPSCPRGTELGASLYPEASTFGRFESNTRRCRTAGAVSL